MLEQMEKLTSFSSTIEICYCNIDSVHFSAPSNLLPDVFDNILTKVSDKMGDYKIESITANGLWLEPGSRLEPHVHIPTSAPCRPSNSAGMGGRAGAGRPSLAAWMARASKSVALAFRTRQVSMTLANKA
ncbi:MAG: hypothetical protein K9K38_01725, partial [Rhodoferax sp.]|nr:hypothetical protein [Rhodoferax sp.]